MVSFIRENRIEIKTTDPFSQNERIQNLLAQKNFPLLMYGEITVIEYGFL